MTSTDAVVPAGPVSSTDAAAAADAAHRLLQLAPEPSRSRTVARLLRYALEQAVDDHWDDLRPGEVTDRSTRARRIRLIAAQDPAIAKEAFAAWCLLSDAARPHIYEMAAPVHELTALYERTQRMRALLAELAIRLCPCS